MIFGGSGMIGRYVPPNASGFYGVVTRFRDWAENTNFVHPDELFLAVLTKEEGASDALRRQVLTEMGSFTLPDLQYGGRGGFVIDGIKGCVVSLAEMKENIASLQRRGQW